MRRRISVPGWIYAIIFAAIGTIGFGAGLLVGAAMAMKPIF
jgi:hypothetical protein